jgi:hypothetical protein
MSRRNGGRGDAAFNCCAGLAYSRSAQPVASTPILVEGVPELPKIHT